MNLAQLIKILELPSQSDSDLDSHDLTRPITSIHYRSQETRPGGLFVAVEGFKVDGHDFINDAAAKGAAVIVAQKPIMTHLPVVVVPNTRKALAVIAAEFYGHPAQKVRLVGITGTSGKTTVSYLLENIFSAADLPCGVIGTINYRYGGKSFANPVTTPESLDLQRILADMRDAGISHVVMEVSSHALDLARVDHCDVDVAVFTNLTQDHLDYHQSMESYWECKKRLFLEHLKSFNSDEIRAQVVINCDSNHGRELFDELRLSKISTGMNPDAMVHAVHPQMSLKGITTKVETPVGPLELASPLVGRHNLENILNAVGTAVAMGVDSVAIKRGIESLKYVPGRLESVPNLMQRHVYVDYAHKPDALANVLQTLRPLLAGRLICVMGCGGDRDKGKRPIMGEIAGNLSDLTIVTSDNPRSESPEEIIAQIVAGVLRSGAHRYGPDEAVTGFSEQGFVVEPDRKLAIQLAVAASKPHDTILIAGKGHENYQIIGSKTVAFDDVSEAKSALGSEGANPWLKN